MTIYQPFTYLVGWSNLGLYYYGSMSRKRAPIANPDIFWKKYFTSSHYVKELRQEHGEPDIIQIRKVFDCGKKCRIWEQKVLRRMKVLKTDTWLNKNVGGTFYFDDEVKHRMRVAKMGEKNHMYGNTHSAEARKKISDYRTGRKLNEDHKDSISQGLYEYYSSEASIKSKEIFRQNTSGDKAIHFSGYFITPWGKFSTIGEALRTSPVLIAKKSIRRWCKKSHLLVCKNTHGRSGYLKSLPITQEEIIKMTFSDLGFGFEPAESKRGT
jgi:hypothetical protein